MDTSTTTQQLKDYRAFLCLECGKCTAVCPISRHNNSYSPRRLVAEGLFYGSGDLVTDRLLWSCLTCQLCSQRCPVDVKYSDYMRAIRGEAHQQGVHGDATHGGALHHVMEMTAAPGIKQNRTEWITKDLKTKKTKGDVLYFVGCLPYQQDFFCKDFDFTPISIAQDTVKILNHLGIEPVVMPNERCCGHDLYWLGENDKFDELADLNLADIAKTGAKTVITACPECALTLKQLYAGRNGKAGFTVKHITEVVAENIDKLEFKEQEMHVSYQDPCRLGRFLGVYDQPRQALSAIPGLELHELDRIRQGAVCCGTTNWMNCDGTSKKIQYERLSEAKAAGADTMVTACPKCQIHFRCSECGDKSQTTGIALTDFVNVIASALKG
jgi:Fe-S oxidoreductase